MYDSLRRRLIAMAVAVLLLIGLIIMSSVYWLVNSWLNRQTGAMASAILENEGRMPSLELVEEAAPVFSVVLPESVYETRFFSVCFDPEGNARDINIRSIASVTEREAIALAKRAASHRRDRGRLIGGRDIIYYYAYEVRENGEKLVAVLDTSSRFQVIRTVTLYMGCVLFTVVVLFIILTTYYSRRLVEPFEENERRQKSFITNASHELKTPLAVILANTEMLEAMNGENKWTQSITRQITRMQRLIQELVTLARMEESEEILSSDIDLSEAVREAAESFEEIFRQRGIGFTVNIPEGIRGFASRRGVQEILSILLDNAAKYCDEGGSAALTLTRTRLNRAPRVVISNTYAAGRGVDVNRFFERFYREDESRHDSQKSGFGIGLSMAKELAGRMKAKLYAGYEGDRISFCLDFEPVGVRNRNRKLS